MTLRDPLYHPLFLGRRAAPETPPFDAFPPSGRKPWKGEPRPRRDLEFHVRHLALPEPGDWRQLCIQAARLLARPMDLTRPPWELYVIEGVDGIHDVPSGSYAMFMKTHHAAIDGSSGRELETMVDAGFEPLGPQHVWIR